MAESEDGKEWLFDPSMAALDRRIARELRREAEAVESDVAESEMRSRTFAEVAQEARNRGEQVAIMCSNRNFYGQIVTAAGDFLTVQTDTTEVDINLADVTYMRVVDKRHQGGQPRQEGPGTFEMRLLERRSPHERAEIGFRSTKDTVIGRVVAVGQDHVVVVDDTKQQWTIPVHSVAFVVRDKSRRHTNDHQRR